MFIKKLFFPITFLLLLVSCGTTKQTTSTKVNYQPEELIVIQMGNVDVMIVEKEREYIHSCATSNVEILSSIIKEDISEAPRKVLNHADHVRRILKSGVSNAKLAELYPQGTKLEFLLAIKPNGFPILSKLIRADVPTDERLKKIQELTLNYEYNPISSKVNRICLDLETVTLEVE